jgi:hypothetical protein
VFGVIVLKRAQAAAGLAARAFSSSRTSPAREADLREARAAFERFVALEAAHDPALAALYADDGVVIEQVIERGIERPAREFPLQRYKAALCETLAISAKAREASSHRGVSYEWLSPGWVKVRSIRAYTHARGPAPYEALLKREADGCWRVAKEIATIIL